MADAPPALEHQQPRIPHKRDVPAPNELPGEVQVRDAAAVVEQVQAMPVTPSACCAVLPQSQAFSRYQYVPYSCAQTTSADCAGKEESAQGVRVCGIGRHPRGSVSFWCHPIA